MVGGILGGILSGMIFQPNTLINIPIRGKTPNQGIRLSARYALITGSTFGLIVCLIFGLTFGLLFSQSNPLFIYMHPNAGLISKLSAGLLLGLPFGLVVAAIGGLLGGGDVVMKHCLLRLILWRKGYIPWNYARFLDYATSLIFLRKVGGGYIFVHRLIMEHFASLDEEAIERITTASTKQR